MLGVPIDVSNRPAFGAVKELRVEHSEIRSLYKQEYRALVGLATLLLGRQQLAEEIVQDTFARVLGEPPRLIEPGHLQAYVRAAVLNRCRSKIRRMILERRHTVAVSDGVYDRYPDHALRAALLELPMRQRQCVALRFYEDRTVEDIADLLSISTGSVKTHLHRGLQRLREHVGEEPS